MSVFNANTVYDEKKCRAKLSAIEELYNQLSNHLTKMEELEKQVGNFWKDEHARTTVQILNSEIERVRYAMQRTKDMINFYKKTIGNLNAVNTTMDKELDDALKIVNSVGNFAK